MVRERVKEQTCLYGISRLLNESTGEVESRLPRIAGWIVEGLQFPDIAAVRISLGSAAADAGPPGQWASRISADIEVSGGFAGSVVVGYLEERDSINGDPFLPEEFELISVIAQMLGQAAERAAASEALRRSETRFRRLWDHVETGIMLVDADTRRIADINPVGSELVGLPWDEIVGRECHDLLCPNARGACPILDHGEEIDRSERQLVRADGSIVPIVKSVTKLNIAGRDMLLESFLDISKLKKAEETLQVTQFAVDNAADSIFWVNSQGRFEYINATAWRMLGYTADEFVKLSVSEIAPEFPAEAWAPHWSELKRAGKMFLETVARTKDGETIPVEMSLTHQVLRGIEYGCAFARDITGRKAREVQQLLALQVLAALNQPSDQALPVREVLGLIKDFAQVEVAAIRIKDGEEYPYFECAGLSSDFIQSENPLCALTEAGEVIHDEKGRCVLECLCGSVLTGMGADLSFSFTSYGSLWTNSLAELMDSGFPHTLETPTRNRCLREGYQSFALVPLRSDNRIVGLLQLADSIPGMFSLEVIHFFEKLTAGIGIAVGREQSVRERERLESQLHQSQKMETVGRLAGGVAHDFNNLLTAIVGYAEMLEDVVGDNTEAAEDLAEITRAADSASNLIGQLLAFSRKQLAAPIVLDVNSAIREAARMLDRLIGEDVEFRFNRGGACWQTRFDPGQLEQVLVNLAVNAREAMPDGGYLTIEAGNAEVHGEECSSCGETIIGSHVMLSVADTGFGMDEHTLFHLFEPFFTTRKESGGTGLGLATVHGIVHQHGGHLSVCSQAGVGTTFKVYLPRVDETPAQAKNIESPEVRGGTETILLAEDSGTVRTLVSRALQDAGYRVLTASDGGEACVKSQTHKGPIDLLLTDVIMPELNGRKAANAISSSRPGIRVLFMSAHTEDAIASRGVFEGETYFLQKPFRTEMLLRKVREVLDAPAPEADPPDGEGQRLNDNGRTGQAELDVSRLSAELVSDVCEMAEMGDAEGLRQLVAGKIQPEHPDLGAIFDQLLDDYAYEKLSELLRSGGNR